MNVNESAENYLETILILSHRLPVVRSVDIANELGFKKSSVSIAMKNLREKITSSYRKVVLSPLRKAVVQLLRKFMSVISSYPHGLPSLA